MQTTKKKISVLTLILIVISLLALSSAAYFWYQTQSKETPKTKIEVPKAQPPVFLTLKPFTIALPTMKNGYEVNKVLYVGMVLRVADELQKSVLLEYLPEVRSELLLLLSNQNINELKDESGKLNLRAQVKETLSRQYDKQTHINIDEVLFTDFIIR